MTWLQGQLKHWLARNDSGTWGEEPDGVNDVVVLRSTDIGIDGSWTIEDPAMRRVSMTERSRKTLAVNDLVVVTSSGSEAHLGKTAIVSPSVAAREPVFANFVQRLTAASNADPRFIRYFLSSKPASEEMATLGNTTTGLRNLNGGIIGAVTFSGPPITEQRAIADYLDAETARIDALITKKQQLIHLLEQRVLTMAVEMVSGFGGEQATGIPTIPFIPTEWQVLRNKVFMREVAELSQTGSEEMLSVSHLTGVTPRSEKTVYMFEAESTVGYKLVRSGDLVINTMWAWMGAAGVSPVDGIVSPAYGVYRIDTAIVLPGWFDLLVRTDPYIVEMTRFSRGVTSSRLRLYPDEFLRLRSPIPTLQTQRKLVGALEDYRLVARRAIDRVTQQLDLLSEHRQALVTAAITGEFQVPGVA